MGRIISDKVAKRLEILLDGEGQPNSLRQLLPVQSARLIDHYTQDQNDDTVLWLLNLLPLSILLELDRSLQEVLAEDKKREPSNDEVPPPAEDVGFESFDTVSPAQTDKPKTFRGLMGNMTGTQERLAFLIPVTVIEALREHLIGGNSPHDLAQLYLEKLDSSQLTQLLAEWAESYLGSQMPEQP